MFQTLTTIHLITVAITLSGFLLRGIWMLQDSANLKRPIVRILPHLNDTILLVSAVWAGALINQYPFFNSWLTAKLMGTLVLYRVRSYRANLWSYSNTTRGCIRRRAGCIRLYCVGVCLPQFDRLLLNGRASDVKPDDLDSGF